MRLMACTALVLAACHPGSDDSFPIAPGGDDTPIVPAPDAPSIADASGDGAITTINGRVCVVDDPRVLTTCAPIDASGITVALGTSTAVTAADGSFTINAELGSNLAWSVTGTGFVPSLMMVGLVNLIPIISEARYSQLLLGNGVVLLSAEGSVFVRVVRNNAPAPAVLAAVDPPSQYGPLYDGASATIWDTDATGTSGVVWIPDVLEGNSGQAATTITLTPPAPATAVMVSPQVTAGAITFATVGIP